MTQVNTIISCCLLLLLSSHCSYGLETLLSIGLYEVIVFILYYIVPLNVIFWLWILDNISLSLPFILCILISTLKKSCSDSNYKFYLLSRIKF